MTKEELRKSLDFVCEERERLQERIEKAVEYINYCDDLSVVNDYSITEKPIIEKIAKKELIDILNGKE